MAGYRRAKIEGGCYFFTVVTERRRPILTDEAIRKALRDAVIQVKNERPFTINAWVLLPDHMHCIWTLPENDADYSTRWRLIKSLVTKQCGKAYSALELLTERRQRQNCQAIWQHRFWEHTIRNEQDLANHIEYTHQNPVKHGYVTDAKDWPYSTIHKLNTDPHHVKVVL